MSATETKLTPVDVKDAITKAYEWANNGGYDSQRTFDESSDTYVGHITACETFEEADNAGPYSGDIKGLPIPFEHLGDSDKVALLEEVRTHAKAALGHIEDEIEQRKTSGNEEYWKDLQDVADKLAAALEAAS